MALLGTSSSAALSARSSRTVRWQSHRSISPRRNEALLLCSTLSASQCAADLQYFAEMAVLVFKVRDRALAPSHRRSPDDWPASSVVDVVFTVTLRTPTCNSSAPDDGQRNGDAQKRETRRSGEPTA